MLLSINLGSNNNDHDRRLQCQPTYRFPQCSLIIGSDVAAVIVVVIDVTAAAAAAAIAAIAADR